MLHHRPDLDGPAAPRGRDPRRDLECGVQVVGLEQVVAAELLLGLEEGPSVVTVLPPCTRTVVAVPAGWSWAPPTERGSAPMAKYS